MFCETKPIIPPPLSPTKSKGPELKVTEEDCYETITENAYALIEEQAQTKWIYALPKGDLPKPRSNHTLIAHKGM